MRSAMALRSTRPSRESRSPAWTTNVRKKSIHWAHDGKVGRTAGFGKSGGQTKRARIRPAATDPLAVRMRVPTHVQIQTSGACSWTKSSPSDPYLCNPGPTWQHYQITRSDLKPSRGGRGLQQLCPRPLWPIRPTCLRRSMVRQGTLPQSPAAGPPMSFGAVAT